MSDFLEIDFLEVGDKGSGDAIAVRHRQNGVDYVYVVDGGYEADGEKLVSHIRTYYTADRVDHVVLTHPDRDHAAGLETVLEELQVGTLWMNRPWVHVDALMPKFERYQDRDRLIGRLRRDFPNVAKLEALAIERGILIQDALQETEVGVFTVLAPAYGTYLDLVVASEKTPVPASKTLSATDGVLLSAAWGEENLKGDTEGTSSENESSVVQFAQTCNWKILLTGDAGVGALTEAYEAALELGKPVTSLNVFQVPHHGSRRNVSSDVLDKWLGAKLPEEAQSPKYRAIVSANRNDPDHPKKAVVRAMIHRGRRVFRTEGTLCSSTGDAPQREGWSPATPLTYPTDMED
ncbi:MAG: MBL fold metallo-hydrolase [Acidobacteriota bacterium]|nr:MBL fold metallo-hydrolase [Acidobacteriota bacterium]